MSRLEEIAKDAKLEHGLTRKQKAFADELLNNPKITGVEAATKHYGRPGKAIDPTVANSIAVENIRKPLVMAYLRRHDDLIEETLIDVVKDWGHEENTRKREIALNNAQYVHDKVHGKATQQIESSTKQVIISIDLTAEDEDLKPG